MIIVLHPFTGDIMKLPPLMPLLKSYKAMVPRSKRYRYAPLNFVASLSVSADGTAAVMIVHQDMPHVFFATTNDKEWSVSNWNLAPLSVPISFQGKLYILTPPAKRSSGKLILLVDPPRHEHAVMPSSLMPPTWIATCPIDKYSNPFSLAECDSEILVICFKDNKMSNTDKLVVYKLEDLAMDKVTPVTSIGGNTLFLDIETTWGNQNNHVVLPRSMIITSRAMPTIVGDTIVRLRHYYPWHYHLRTGRWSPLFGGCVNNPYSMSGGCTCSLIYHIYHSCHCSDARRLLERNHPYSM
jgi:hypothetical protein